MHSLPDGNGFFPFSEASAIQKWDRAESKGYLYVR